MKQLTLAAVGFERYVKTTRRAAFLTEMERIVPWRAIDLRRPPDQTPLGHGEPDRNALLAKVQVSSLTHRWRKMDWNHRSLAGWVAATRFCAMRRPARRHHLVQPDPERIGHW